jgi:hypothetical protein
MHTRRAGGVHASLGAAAGALAAIAAGPAGAERLLGFSLVEQALFKLDTADGELVKFPGHAINALGGLDVDSQGNVYYLGNNILRRIDLDQPANDVFVGLIPGVVFEGFEIVNDHGYAAEVFTGTMYRINLVNAAITAIGQYGAGGVDRITGLASTDYPGSKEALHLYGVRVFLDDIIEVSPVNGGNLGTVVSDPLLGVTNLAYGPGARFWFVNGQTLYELNLGLQGAAGLAAPVIEDLDLAGVDGLTVVHPEPQISTRSLPGGAQGEPYGPVALAHEGGGPGIQWVALSDGYEESNLGVNRFALVGLRQGMQGQDVVKEYALPFAFPYYGASHATVWVCNNGFLDFNGPATDPANGDGALAAARRICPLWDDLRTNAGNRDVHIDSTVPGQVTFRWDALQVANNGIVNFSCTLHVSGAIQFNYGVPNAGLTATVGISAGDGSDFIISRYSGMPNLGSAASLRFEPTGGLPPGVALSASGVLAGTPLGAGDFSATVRLTDALGGHDERELALHVAAPCPADIDGSGDVGINDFLALLGSWGPNPGHPADLDGSGTVDVVDFLALLAAWGPCPG